MKRFLPMVMASVLVLPGLLACGGRDEQLRVRRADAVLDAGKLWVDRRISEGPLSLADPKLVSRDLSFAHALVDERTVALPWALRMSLARGLLERMQRKSVELAPTEEELKKQKERLWLELDRPPSRRAIEVFIPVPPLANDAEEAAVAAKIAEATKDDDHPQTFAEHAQALQEEGVRVLLSVLPPLTADHRIAPLDHHDDPNRDVPREVCDALFRLAGPGSKSGVIGSPKGFHLLFFVETYPEARLAEPELGERLKAAVVEVRLAPELGSLRNDLRGRTKVTLEGGVDAALELAWAARLSPRAPSFAISE